MKEISFGLFELEEDMPCSPDNIRVLNYFVPNFLCEKGKNEIIARLLCFSCINGRWLGVSWRKILKTIKQDCAQFRAYQKDELLYNRYFRLWESEMADYMLYCILSLGAYSFFAKKPKRPKLDTRNLGFPKSGIYEFGLKYIVSSLDELLEQGMLEKEVVGDEVVFSPTNALIFGIYNCQRYRQ